MGEKHKETLDSMIEESCTFAKTMFGDKGELHPVLVGYVADGTGRIVIPMVFENNEELMQVLFVAKLAFAAYAVDRYVVMHEGWKSVQDNPDRVAVLNVIAVGAEEKKMRTYTISPDRTLSDPQNREGVRGRFTDLLHDLPEGEAATEALRRIGMSELSDGAREAATEALRRVGVSPMRRDLH